MSAADPCAPARTWNGSIDAVYELFENKALRSRYPRLAELVEAAVAVYEDALDTYGYAAHCRSADKRACSIVPSATMVAKTVRKTVERALTPGTVTAHILAAVLRRREERRTGAAPRLVPCLEALYVASDSPFAELEDFIAFSAAPETGYNLSLVKAHGSLRDALASYVDGTLVVRGGIAELEPKSLRESGSSVSGEMLPSRHDVRAMFIGVRRNDPHGASLHVRSPCDPGWPDIMRVHPILDWDYSDIWAFLRCSALGCPADLTREPDGAPRRGVAGGGADGVPYCSLYDEGYTSLGSTYNTQRNPRLKVPDTSVYRPAYELKSAADERAGRIAAPQQQ